MKISNLFESPKNTIVSIVRRGGKLSFKKSYENPKERYEEQSKPMFPISKERK